MPFHDSSDPFAPGPSHVDSMTQQQSWRSIDEVLSLRSLIEERQSAVVTRFHAHFTMPYHKTKLCKTID
ncbi:hypothetical protein Tcan_18787 [Toxocara canis]|uniref:Uncharacterized protein n=1 Tax=Toxocara canis TaxID=6265 RepID=A0A0B2VMC6_TOXCA|nr:hypothetical protein Tcan_18787 [Toxocara canis]